MGYDWDWVGVDLVRNRETYMMESGAGVLGSVSVMVMSDVYIADDTDDTVVE